MTKIINAPAAYVDESLQGLCLAHPSLKIIGDEGRVVARAATKEPGKVGIASGGGFGHLPLFCGYVGAGLLDACAVGNVFEGPTVGTSLDSIARASSGAGVLCLIGNYGGDRMNFEMAGEMAGDDGIETELVLGTDDVASAPESEREKRRGVARAAFCLQVRWRGRRGGARVAGGCPHRPQGGGPHPHHRVRPGALPDARA